ncbi:hypothetical protein C1X05_04595 [Laceyella sacchari]|nr:hypothetical protein C1X05_04595 [Laceyella sacchari]
MLCDRGIFGFSEKQEGIYSIVNQFIKDMLFLGMHAGDRRTSLSEIPWRTCHTRLHHGCVIVATPVFRTNELPEVGSIGESP